MLPNFSLFLHSWIITASITRENTAVVTSVTGTACPSEIPEISEVIIIIIIIIIVVVFCQLLFVLSVILNMHKICNAGR